MKALIALASLVGIGALFLVLRTGGPGAPARPDGRGASQASPERAPGGALGDELEALRAEVRALRAEQAELVQRLGEVESRPPVLPAREPVVPAPAAAAEPGLSAALGDPGRAAPELETFVLDVLSEKEERERAEREQRRLAALAGLLEERVAELATELGLSPYQQQELLGILGSEATQRDAFFEELRSGGSWDRRAVRDGLSKLREGTLSALTTVLTPDQLERYRELDPRPAFFGGGFGPGGDERGRDERGREGGRGRTGG